MKSHAAATEPSVVPKGSMNCMYKYGDKSNRGSGFTTTSGFVSTEYTAGIVRAAAPAPMVLMNCRLVLRYVLIFNLSFANRGLPVGNR